MRHGSEGDLQASITSLAYLSLDIAFVTVFALGMALPVLYWSPSSFTCQYLGHYTLAFKRDIGDVSGGVMGCAITVVIVTLFKYCFESKHTSSSTTSSISSISSISVASSHLLSMSSQSTYSPLTTPPPTPPQAQHGSNLDLAPLTLRPSETSLLPSNQLQHSLLHDSDYHDKTQSEGFADLPASSRTLSVLLVALIVSICIVATLFPNVIYVLILVNSNSSAVMKTAAQVGISLVKVVLGCYAVPFIAVRSLRLFVETEEDGATTAKLASLYRDRVVVEIIHAAASLIVFPVAVVMVADPRCYYYYFRPRGSVTTTVYVTFCSDTNLQGECLEYDKMPIDSTFHYNFDFDGEQCVSAIFETYTPVFITTPLISAALDICIGECLLPLMHCWKQWYNKGSMEDEDLVSSPNMWLNHQEGPTQDSQSVKTFYEAAVKVSRQVVERARRRLLLLMLTICTFGLGAPLVSVSCLFSALVVFTYHVHLLGRVSALVDKRMVESEGGEHDMKEMNGWDGVPRGCGVALTFTTVAFWTFVSFLSLNQYPSFAALPSLSLSLWSYPSVTLNSGDG